MTLTYVFRPVICWSTFGSDYSLESSWVWRYKLGTPVFGEFLPFFSADPLKLCQVGWGMSLCSYFQVFPEVFDWVQVRALAGPLKGIQRLVPKPLLRCLGCVRGLGRSLSGWKVNLLPSLGSWALWSRISSRISLYFAPFIFASILTSLQSQHPRSMMLPPPCFTVGMVQGFLQMWLLAFRPKSSILVSSDQIILFLISWYSLGTFWQTPTVLSCDFY